MNPQIGKIINSIKNYTKENNPRYIIKHAVSFFVGFVLSPLSWWNDLFVNVPLAWAMTWPVLKLISFLLPISRNFFLATFIFNYWITNIVGMAMMHYSGKKLINKDAKFDIMKDFIVGIIYSIIVTIIFIANPGEILSSLHIIPSWVK